MRLVHTSAYDAALAPPSHHILTYAEVGFAPLNIHTRHLDLPNSQLEAFAAEVNLRNETGTLLPIAPVSAVPRSAIRDSKSVRTLARHIAEFLAANESIGATTLVLDFRAPRLGSHVIPAAELALAQSASSQVREVIVLQ